MRAMSKTEHINSGYPHVAMNRTTPNRPESGPRMQRSAAPARLTYRWGTILGQHAGSLGRASSERAGRDALIISRCLHVLEGGGGKTSRMMPCIIGVNFKTWSSALRPRLLQYPALHNSICRSSIVHRL